jgi:mannosyltransferase
MFDYILKKARMRFDLLIILLIGILLRGHNLAAFGFWFDEACCLQHAEYFFRDIVTVYLKMYVTDGATFVILLKLWMFFFHSDLLIRLLPVICGVLSIAVIYYLGERIFSKSAGRIAALLLSISPLHVYYSQELTYYSLSVFLALASSYCLLQLLSNRGRAWSVLYVAATVAFVCNHPVNPLFLLVQNLFFFLFFRKDDGLRKKWMRLQSAVFLLSLPWISVVAWQFLLFARTNVLFWIPKPDPGTLAQSFMLFSLGYHSSQPMQLVALGIFLFFSISALIRWRGEKNLFYLLFWLLIPPAVLWLVSQYHSAYLHRVFVFSLPAYCLLAAGGFVRSRKYVRMILLAPWFIVSAFTFSRYYGNMLPEDSQGRYVAVFPRKEYAAAARYISERFREGDLILHVCRSSFLPLLYYHEQRFPEFGIEVNHVCKKDWTVIYGNFKIYNHAGRLQDTLIAVQGREDLRNYKRIWLVHSSWDRSGRSYLPGSDGIGKMIVGWFDRNFTREDLRMFDGINVYLYQNR